jgi:cytochrome c551/c552
MVAAGAALILIGFIAIQFIPVSRTNPPVVSEPQWDSPATKALVRQACYDCHSNETVWPWYSYVAPMSWLVAHDVSEGRRHMNFSQWNPGDLSGDQLAQAIKEDRMPPWNYRLLHPGANLSDSDKAALTRAFLQLDQ